MITLSKLTKEDAKKAAMEFLGIIAMWTDCFFDEKAGARLLKIDEESYEGGDINYDGSTEALESYIEKSDLENSVFVIRIQEIFNFAQTGVWDGVDSINGNNNLEAWISDALLELGTFQNVFGSRPRLSFKDDGVTMLGGKDDPILETLFTITEAARARWNLLERLDLTLDEIALLAGVGIKTVRNAVSSKGPDRLIVAGRQEDKTVVDADEAYRWLLTKRGFTGPFLYEEEPPYNTYETLGQFRHHCYVLRTLAKLEIADLAKQLGWNKSHTQAYNNLENLDVSERLSILTPNTLLELGKFYKSENLNTFVIEGSRILASAVAEYQAKQLFN
ncbi:hypothetical protein [Methylotuvimicrobium buryatense]|uniref:Uncharacterized protein n=1 Tax=Methylotuvimicrobium buryatense TaxID=95641 RepID=A0A4P9USR1_METBY|nr:hypothetical protein [Methylotuvimicrobium buryatense]QCW84578.1 hypothetical protein EQU24_21795 [Methylotuvimicrobium buryatense]